MLVDWLEALLSQWIGMQALLSFFVVITSLLAVILFVGISFYFSRQLVRPWINRMINWFEGDTLDATVDERPALASHVAHLIPAMLLVELVPFFFGSWPWWEAVIHAVTWLYLYLFIALSFAALADVTQAILAARNPSSNIPFKVISQLAKLLIVMLLIIMSISLLMGASPAYLLSGLGALTAVLLLVFRDALLGFVASIQIAANRMVSTGDWIEMPKYGADGSVIELALTTVKVRQMQPSEVGLPIEVYCFSADKNWANYERIQSDIFDNLLATLPLFDLQAFQRVSSRRDWYAETMV